MLNPSTADAHRDDPTLTRCVAFARAWGAGSIEVVNLFARVSTDPAALRGDPDPVGPRNRPALRRALARADIVVAGWGNVDRSLRRAAGATSRLLPVGASCLGVTAQGQPRHPLYLRTGAARVPFPLTLTQQSPAPTIEA